MSVLAKIGSLKDVQTKLYISYTDSKYSSDEITIEEFYVSNITALKYKDKLLHKYELDMPFVDPKSDTLIKSVILVDTKTSFIEHKICPSEIRRSYTFSVSKTYEQALVNLEILKQKTVD
jgi:hypothetical protein